jgi:hypothetical protein
MCRRQRLGVCCFHSDARSRVQLSSVTRFDNCCRAFTNPPSETSIAVSPFKPTSLITSTSINMSRKRRTEDMLFEPASKRHDPSSDGPTPLSSHDNTVPTRICLVCDETKPTYTGFPKIPHVSEHGHGNDVCYTCYRLHLDAEVDNKMWDQVSCPQCPLLLKKIEIWALATVETMIKHMRFTDRAAASTNPAYRYCLSTACDAGQVHDGELVFTCQTCNHKHCTACEINWHDDETCEEYQARHQTQKQQEADSEEKIRTLTKFCPRCDSPIEKSEGCDHMTCKSTLLSSTRRTQADCLRVDRFPLLLAVLLGVPSRLQAHCSTGSPPSRNELP